MAHNFKLVGDIYVSKEGNDTTGDGSADNPFASIQSGIDTATSGNSIVVGAGMYNEALSLNKNNIRLKGDGTVYLTSSTGDILLSSNGGSMENFTLYDIGAGKRTLVSNFGFYGCLLKDIYFTNFGNNARSIYSKVIFLNVTQDFSSHSTTIVSCMVINSYIGNINNNLNRCYNNYIDLNSTFSNSISPSSQNLRNNCITGALNIAGTIYSLYRNKDGNPIVPINDHPDIETLIADVYTTRACFNQDPEFGNLSKGDYRYVADASPLLQAASDGRNIGNVYKGVLRTMDDTDLNPGQFTEDVGISASNDWVYNGPDGEGGVVTKAIQVSSADDEILKFLNFAAAFNFNSDDPKGSPDNLNVLAKDNFLDGTPGANPRRLTYEMRWSTQASRPNEDPTVFSGSGWDNNNNLTEGSFATFEVNSQPLIDHNGKGNGAPEFNKNTAGNLTAKWVQLMITIQEGIG